MNRAVGVGYVKAVEACLDAGMDVNKKGPLGTPLDQAIKWWSGPQKWYQVL
jgi:hypothetical protein